MTRTISRRQMLTVAAATGGGLLVAFYLAPRWLGGPERSSMPAPPAGEFAPNAWLRIAPDNTVTIMVDRSEMGQGVMTALPMILAEELGADWARVRAEFAVAHPVYGNPLGEGVQQTGGSTAIAAGWDILRRAGATAREMLITAAASRLGVPASECRAINSRVEHAASGQGLSFGDVADAAAKLAVPENVPLKPASAFTLVGKPLARLDTAAKVSGQAIFGIDVTVPGLLVATVIHPPVFGSRARRFDAGKAETMPGVKRVLSIPSGIAVVADTFWHASRAADTLKVEWEETPNDTLDDAAIGNRWAKIAETDGERVRDDGDVDAALAEAASVVVADYQTPYQAHAAPEPKNCTADVRDKDCEVWVPTQNQTFAHQVAQDLTGFGPDAVTVHTTFLGGGFGGRHEPDIVAEAVRISQALGAPVKVIWSRSEDLQHEHYHPASWIRMKAGLSDDGTLVAWSHHLVAPAHLANLMPFYRFQKVPGWLPDLVRSGVSAAIAPLIDKMVLKKHATEGAADMPYAVKNVAVSYSNDDPGIPTGNWRSVAHAYNAFAVESFIDELAARRGADPLAFRRELLGDHRQLLAVLEMAAKMSGWGEAQPDRTGLGIAAHDYKGTRVAEVARVTVSPEGRVRVTDVFCAVDCGLVVNPAIVRAQIESAIAFGLSATLKGAITISNGRVDQNNLHDFPVIGMDEMPRVAVQIVDSTAPPRGIGEVGVPPIAPAVANAVFAATGIRIRKLPIRPQALRDTEGTSDRLL